MNNSQQSHIGSDTVKLTGSKIITMMISLVSGMLLSRFRTLTEYGTYSQLLMAINLVCSVLMLGLPNSINYFLAKAKTQEEKDAFLSVYYTLNTILSIVVGLVLIAATPLLERIFHNDLIRDFWYFLAFFPWTKIIMSSVEHLLIVCRKTDVLMIYRLANSAALLGVIFAVQVCGGTFGTYMVLYLVTETVFTLWTYRQVLCCTTHFRPGLNPAAVKTIFAFSVPIGIASMIGTVNIELDKIVITSFFSTEELAVYTNASKELPVTIIAASLTAVLLPQMVRLLHEDKKDEAVALWNSAVIISFAFISFIAAACIVFAPEVITVLYSAKYLGGTSVFRVYCLVLLLRCTYFGMFLNAIGRTKFILYSSIGTLVLNILLNYCFYSLFGFIGPAIATLLSSLLMNLLQLFCSSKVGGIAFSRIFPWKGTFRILLLDGVLGFAAFLLHRVLCGHIVPVLSAILVGLLWLTVTALVLYKPVRKQWKILNR